MKQLTLSPPDRAIMMHNPYRDNNMADGRAVILAGAFMQAFHAGRVTGRDVIEATRTILARPQLSHIDGRPC